jgi:HPt (histidine-containing phosphotransfer) domain-containing protein
VYLSEAPEYLAAMALALDAEDSEKVVFNAHSLKSSSANMGAIAVSRLSGELEAAATRRDLIASRRILGELSNAFDRVAAALASDRQEESGRNRPVD